MTFAKPLLTATALLVLAAGTPGERVVDPTGTATVTVAGVPATVRLDPAANGVLILTDDLADRAKLRAGPIGFYFGVGPENVAGHSAVRPVSFGGKATKRRISWTARPSAPGFDGAIGPAGVPEEVVTFVLRAPQPGERTVTLPMVGGGGLFGRYDALERFPADVSRSGIPISVRI